MKLFKLCRLSVLALTFLFSVSVEAEAPRIVTVGGAATEIVFALGAGNSIVAVDTSSTFPPKVRMLPQVGYVRNISPEGILSFEPTLVVATGALGPPPARQMMERFEVPVVWLPDPNSVEDLRSSVRSVATELNMNAEGDRVLAEIDADLEMVRSRYSGTDARPKVLFFLQPPTLSSAGMAGGLESRADALIELAGGQNAATEFKGFRPVSWEGLVQMNPDVIIIGMSPGHGGTPEDVEALRESRALGAVGAIQNGAVYGVPLDDLTFGPRLGEAAQRWSEFVHPDPSE
ncbi:MAG: ABC transporter substrate-binding protein [Verrucomicrobiota bacterium]